MFDEYSPPPAKEVLASIWEQSTGQNVFLPYIRYGKWVEDTPYTPAAASTMTFDEPVVDYYFSPLRYNGKRNRVFVGGPGVIFADLDSDFENDFGNMPPSVIIQSSQFHYHAYWYLDNPASLVDWEPKAKGWSQAVGADPGGWDATQVLRVPGTRNMKYEDQFTRVIRFRPDRKYPLSAFPSASIHYPDGTLGPLPGIDTGQRWAIIKDGIETGDLPLTARYWLTVTSEEIAALGKIDRSVIMWQVEKSLISAGYSVEQVYVLMSRSAINKWANTPEKLWREVHKAAASA